MTILSFIGEQTADLVLFKGPGRKAHTPDRTETRADLSVIPLSMDTIGVLIPFDRVLHIGTLNESSVQESLIYLASQCLPGDWKNSTNQTKLYTTNAGYLVMFARITWEYVSPEIDLSVLDLLSQKEGDE